MIHILWVRRKIYTHKYYHPEPSLENFLHFLLISRLTKYVAWISFSLFFFLFHCFENNFMCCLLELVVSFFANGKQTHFPLNIWSLPCCPSRYQLWRLIWEVTQLIWRKKSFAILIQKIHPQIHTQVARGNSRLYRRIDGKTTAMLISPPSHQNLLGNGRPL